MVGWLGSQTRLTGLTGLGRERPFGFAFAAGSFGVLEEGDLVGARVPPVSLNSKTPKLPVAKAILCTKPTFTRADVVGRLLL